MAILRRASAILPGLVFIVLVLAGLEFLVQRGFINRALFPPPSVVGGTLWDLIASGAIARPLGTTMVLFASGYVLAVVCGVALGLVMGTSRTVAYILDPLIESIRPMPKAALLPVLMLFLGLGPTMKITAVVLASFFPVLINTIQGVRGTDPVLIATGRTFGLGPTAISIKIVLPAALPYIFAGMRVAVALALLMTILTEMLAGGGLGYLVLENERSFRIREMYAWLVILAAVGLIINLAMARAEQRFVPWLDKNHSG
jgi:ABC-type nitrate/sulfonate/bicarbonate transport system permease component